MSRITGGGDLSPFEKAMIAQLAQMNATLVQIATSLSNGEPDTGPNYQRKLVEYPDFDWSEIGAEIVRADSHGATVVRWHGREYTRRRHADYDASLWFSRSTGHKGDDGKTVYARLITFTDRARVARGLPEEVTERLPDRTPPPATKPQAAGFKVPALKPDLDPNLREIAQRVIAEAREKGDPGLIESRLPAVWFV